jgi:hypothetical protein
MTLNIEKLERLPEEVREGYFLAYLLVYTPPDGKNEVQQIELPDRYKEVYADMQSRGCRLEAELLGTGMVSLTITSDVGDEDIRVVPQGIGIFKALHSMLDARRRENAKKGEEV